MSLKLAKRYSLCYGLLRSLRNLDLYRKLPLKNTGDIQNLPDGTILVKNHWIF